MYPTGKGATSPSIWPFTVSLLQPPRPESWAQIHPLVLYLHAAEGTSQPLTELTSDVAASFSANVFAETSQVNLLFEGGEVGLTSPQRTQASRKGPMRITEDVGGEKAGDG